MQETTIIQVPVATYVRRVLEKDTPPDPDGAIHIRENSWAGGALSHIQAELPFASRDVRREHVKLKISHRLAARYRHWQGPELYQLGAFYERCAQRILCAWIDCAVAFGHTQTDCIERAYHFFDIGEDDYPRENLVQLYKERRMTPVRQRAH